MALKLRKKTKASKPAKVVKRAKPSKRPKARRIAKPAIRAPLRDIECSLPCRRIGKSTKVMSF